MIFQLKVFRLWAAILLLAGALSLSAAENKFDVQENDTVTSLLTRQKGQIVQLYLKSGEKVAGRVEAVGAHLVHVMQPVGDRSYEAAVSISEISAVVVPTKGK